MTSQAAHLHTLWGNKHTKGSHYIMMHVTSTTHRVKLSYHNIWRNLKEWKTATRTCSWMQADAITNLISQIMDHLTMGVEYGGLYCQLHCWSCWYTHDSCITILFPFSTKVHWRQSARLTASMNYYYPVDISTTVFSYSRVWYCTGVIAQAMGLHSILATTMHFN